MLEFLVGIIVIVIMLLLGGFVLLAGRRSLWATLGIVSLVASANLLVAFVDQFNSTQELFESGDWLYILLALAGGGLGVYLGLNRRSTAILALGFLAGVYMALWFQDIIAYLTTKSEPIPDDSAQWFILLVIFIGGFIGLYVTRHFPDEALILIAMFVGVDIIRQALNLSPTSIFTAIIMLVLSLLGVVVQYADYLRELKAGTPLAASLPVMMEPSITEQYL